MRYLGLILAFMLITGLAKGQSKEFAPEWSFGANGGITMSKVSFVSGLRTPQENFMQGEGGITVRYISEPQFGIVAELNYSMRGWKERTDTAYLNRYTRSLAYIELPIMTHLYFNLGKYLRLIFQAGPQIGYNIGERVLDSYIDEATEPYPTRRKQAYEMAVQRKFDYGIRGGGGFEVRTGIGSFVVEACYFYGLSDIFNSTRSDIFVQSSNQILGVKLTYLR